MTRKLRRGLILGGLAIIVLGGGLWLANRLLSGRIPTEAPVEGRAAQAGPQFPSLRGTNLLGREVRVPAGLDGAPLLIVVAYDDGQQPDVESWLTPLEQLNAQFPNLRGYYVPLLPEDAADNALFIIGGMSLYAGNNRDRERTIAVFTDVDAFNALVDVPDKSQVRLFVLDADNRIVWQTAGGYQPDKLAALADVLADWENSP